MTVTNSSITKKYQIGINAKRETETQYTEVFAGTIGEALGKGKMYCSQKYGAANAEVISVNKIS